jgi:hypothetical protein
VGKVFFAPAAGFALERDVNVVQVSFGNQGPLTVKTQGTPSQVNGRKTSQIEASRIKGADANNLSNVAIFLDANGNGVYDTTGQPGDDALLVNMNGPVVGGIQRGIQFIMCGFTQQAQMAQQFGHYVVGGVNEYLTGSLQDGKTHWDGSVWSSIQHPDSYLHGSRFNTNGITGYQMYFHDDPIFSATDPLQFDINGSKVQDLNLKFVNQTYFAVGTDDKGVLTVSNKDRNSGPNSIQTIRLSVSWTFNGSGKIDNLGFFHPIPNVTGVTSATPAFNEVTNGAKVPYAEANLNGLIGVGVETWKLS